MDVAFTQIKLLLALIEEVLVETNLLLCPSHLLLHPLKFASPPNELVIRMLILLLLLSNLLVPELRLFS